MYESLDDLRTRTAPSGDRALLGGEVDAAASGAVLELAATTYATPLVLSRGITLRGSAGGPTVLAGEEGAPLLQVCSDQQVVLERLVLRGGGGPLGAIALPDAPVDLILRDCVILDCSCTREGPAAGGVTVTFGEVVADGCLFVGNRGSAGGALSARRMGRLTARGCLFVDNAGDDGGGAVWTEEGARARLFNATLVDNCSGDAGRAQAIQSDAVRGSEPEVSLVHCVLDSPIHCFGFDQSGCGRISAGACVLPAHAEGFGPLSADEATWFGEVPLAARYPFPLRTGTDAPPEGDPSADPEAGRGLFGADLRAGGRPVRGAVRPRPAT